MKILEAISWEESVFFCGGVVVVVLFACLFLMMPNKQRGGRQAEKIRREREKPNNTRHREKVLCLHFIIGRRETNE